MIKVFRKDPRARLPEKASPGAIGWDLFALEDTEIPPGEVSFIRTGLVIKAPSPYGMFIFPRSSLFRKKGLIFPHSAGIIDFDYCGEDDELKILALNLKDEPVLVSAGERIAQLLFMKVLTDGELEEVSEVPCPKSRGGFGSTGGYEK
ncbi:deoxyuridine 5'-triphosphate nucleotidohydrolase Dut [Thermodesulfatator indicus DSM 15286]|uniref:dUTP diphosphatase n=1 Tax=Thermodesulfatator indicus (strain DSM 15286 / JCM 11887 / CIR29812) TaxID=667014 RepID=F8A859_THEID|nr:dUTP diphosphatase [Thermodesulfatator indicus]AEH45059.1 deoxyuridine 5'-triphosphate nucleotidohydrolase Dut [Thermodesulfatator indicus DSM 15286]